MHLSIAVRRWLQARAYLRKLRAHPELGLATLFDDTYYRTQYRGSLPPLVHFTVAGAFEGLNPHPLFDTNFYLRKYPDVAASGVNPLFHYLLHGASERRKPHPLFEPEYYSAQFATPPAHPLVHYLAASDGTAIPHPLFADHPKALIEVARKGFGPRTAGAQFARGTP